MKDFLAIILISLSTLISCKQSATQIHKPATLIKVTDFRNKEIALSKPVERIVCLIESALSGIYMLQAQNQVVAVPSSVYYESVAPQYAILDNRIREKIIPAPGNWDFVSIENIITLKPDLVIIWTSQVESIKSIEEHGIPVYGVFLDSFEDVYKEIRDLGTLTGRRHRADSLVHYTQNEISRLQSDLGLHSANKKYIYFMWTQGLLETAGTTSTVNELIEMAGAKNSCTIAQEHVVINKEHLLEWNPDAIVMWNNPLIDPSDIINTPDLGYLKAVRVGQVYEFPPVFFCDLWTLKFTYSLKLIAKWCYPSTFSELNMEEEKRNMLIHLYGPQGLMMK